MDDVVRNDSPIFLSALSLISHMRVIHNQIYDYLSRAVRHTSDPPGSECWISIRDLAEIIDEMAGALENKPV